MNEGGGKTSLWEKATSIVRDNMSLSYGYQNPTMDNNTVSIYIVCATRREVTKHPLEIIVLDTCCMKRLLDSNTKRERDGRIFTIPRL